MRVSRGVAPLAAKLLAAPAVFPSAARSVHARRSEAECRAKSLEASFTGKPTSRHNRRGLKEPLLRLGPLHGWVDCFRMRRQPSASMVGIVGNTPGSDHFETTTG